MAQRRMFSKEITTSDKFVDMPQSTRLLYYDLGMEADDEGFIGNARMLSRAYGANIDDLKLLQAKGFIIIFESGVTVVKDWNVNNQIRKDRMKQTIYQAERDLLSLDNTGVYHLVNQMPAECQPNARRMSTKCPPSIGKDRLGKDRLGKSRLGKQQQEQSPGEMTDAVRSKQESVSDAVQADKKAIWELYGECFGLQSIGEIVIQEIDYMLEDTSADLILLALRETKLNAGRSIKYTQSIINRWKSKGLTTVEQVKASQKAYLERQKKGVPSSVSGGTNVPEWSNPDYKAPDLDSLKVEVPDGYVEDPDAF